ncbi:MAG: metalloregulator ArsR/SmtB family transcription factor [Candidatus Woesearchaeota archaeon]
MKNLCSSEIQLFRALGEETKFRILKLLASGDFCACEIPKLIDRTQSNTSMQLAQLLKLGLVRNRRAGRSIIYSLNDERVIKIFRMLKCYDDSNRGCVCAVKRKKMEGKK